MTEPTPVEVEALAAYARTGTIGRAASELQRSESRVKARLTRLYRKVGAVGAVDAMRRLGWLRIPGP